MSHWAIGIDIGGTFTDVVALDHTRGKYDIAIFEGFVPPAKRS